MEYLCLFPSLLSGVYEQIAGLKKMMEEVLENQNKMAQLIATSALKTTPEKKSSTQLQQFDITEHGEVCVVSHQSHSKQFRIIIGYVSTTLVCKWLHSAPYILAALAGSFGRHPLPSVYYLNLIFFSNCTGEEPLHLFTGTVQNPLFDFTVSYLT